jgi:hypothetical protein
MSVCDYREPKKGTVQARVLDALGDHPAGLRILELVDVTGAPYTQVRNALTALARVRAVRHSGYNSPWIRERFAERTQPQKRRCLVCGLPHQSKHIGDRLHHACRAQAGRDDHRFAP